jgi:CxxC-x17-CxxC domain-containing protein
VLYSDRILTCADCGSEFVFTAGEQEFHASKGFTNDPRRCPSCRAARRSARGEGGGGYSNERSYGEPRREMYEAVCAACGRVARVPFQPRGDRPVYCSDCFSPRGGGGGGRDRDSRGGGRGRGRY